MNLFRKIFGNSESESRNRMSIQEAEIIVQAYGQLLKNNSPAPGCVADSSKLPHPKNQIKDALVLVLKHTPKPEIKTALSNAYVHLANWQDGVGEADTGLNYSELDPEGDIDDLVNSVLSSDSNENNHWQSTSMKEAVQLQQEIDLVHKSDS